MALTLTGTIDPAHGYYYGRQNLTIYGTFDHSYSSIRVRFGPTGAWQTCNGGKLAGFGTPPQYVYVLTPPSTTLGAVNVYVCDIVSHEGEDNSIFVANGFTYHMIGDLDDYWRRLAQQDAGTYEWGYQHLEKVAANYEWQPETVCWRELNRMTGAADGVECWRLTYGPSKSDKTVLETIRTSKEYASNAWAKDGACIGVINPWGYRESANTSILHMNPPTSGQNMRWLIRADGSHMRIAEGIHVTTDDIGFGWAISHPLVDSDRTYYGLGYSKYAQDNYGSYERGVTKFLKHVVDDANAVTVTFLLDAYGDVGEPQRTETHGHSETEKLEFAKNGVQIDIATGLDRYFLFRTSGERTWPVGDERPSYPSTGIMRVDLNVAQMITAYWGVSRRMHNYGAHVTGTCQYYLSDVDVLSLEGLPAGAHFTKRLRIWDERNINDKSQIVNLTAGQVATSYGYSWSNRPNNPGWQIGDWEVRVYVTAANANVNLEVGVTKVNAAGTVVDGPKWDPVPQTLNAIGLYTFTPTAAAWAGTTLTDRVRIDYKFTNTDGANPQSVTIELGSRRTKIQSEYTLDLVTAEASCEDQIDWSGTADYTNGSTTVATFAPALTTTEDARYTMGYITGPGNRRRRILSIDPGTNTLTMDAIWDGATATGGATAITADTFHKCYGPDNEFHGGSLFAIDNDCDRVIWMPHTSALTWFSAKVTGSDVDGGPLAEEFDDGLGDFGAGELRMYSNDYRWGWNKGDTDAYRWPMPNGMPHSPIPVVAANISHPYFGHPSFDRWGEYVLYGKSTSSNAIPTECQNGTAIRDRYTGVGFDGTYGNVDTNVSTWFDGDQFDGRHHVWDGWCDSVLFWPYYIDTRRMGSYQTACLRQIDFVGGTLGALTELGEMHALSYDADHEITYDALPRPSQSPDGTKVQYTTGAWRHFYEGTLPTRSDRWACVDVCWMVAYYPYPPDLFAPVKPDANHVRIQWTSPKYTTRPWPVGGVNPPEPREIKYYHVWQAPDDVGVPGDWIELTTTGVAFTGGTNDFYDVTIGPGQQQPFSSTYYYAVTSEEHSRLESHELSNIWSVTLDGIGALTEVEYAVQGTTGWWTTAPTFAPTLTITARNPAHLSHYRIDFTEPNVALPAYSKIRYYNIYYSNTGINPTKDSQHLVASVPVGQIDRHDGWLDWCADTTIQGLYGVSAVDRQGNESALVFPGALAPAPVISFLYPNSGGEQGGTPVDINGTYFQVGATVAFDGVPATNIVVVNPTLITCISPPHLPGSILLEIENPDLQTDTETFIYIDIPPPNPVVVIPSEGPATGGTLVNIEGTGFIDGLTVTFGGSPATNIIVENDTSILCRVPAHAPGEVPCIVTNPYPPNHWGYVMIGFTYKQPLTITNVTPNEGPVSGGTAVTLTGTTFKGGATVMFDTGYATNVVLVNDTTITCDTPPHGAGSVAVRVINTDLEIGTLFNGFRYISPEMEAGELHITGQLVFTNRVSQKVFGAKVDINAIPQTQILPYKGMGTKEQ